MSTIQQIEQLKSSMRAKKLQFLEEQKKDKAHLAVQCSDLISSKLAFYGFSNEAIGSKNPLELVELHKRLGLIIETINWLSLNRNRIVNDAWQNTTHEISSNEIIMLEELAPLLLTYDHKFKIFKKIQRKAIKEFGIKSLTHLPVNNRFNDNNHDQIRFNFKGKKDHENDEMPIAALLPLFNIKQVIFIYSGKKEGKNVSFSRHFNYHNIGAGFLSLKGLMPNNPLYNKRYFLTKGYGDEILSDAVNVKKGNL